MFQLLIKQALVSCCAIMAMTSLNCHTKKQKVSLPVIGDVSTFSLMDHNAQSFSPELLRGKVWTVNFFFTSCPSVCPSLMANIRSLQENTSDIEKAFHIISISVDPETDVPSTLKIYAKTNSYSLTNWSLLTGHDATIRKVATNSFKQAIGEKQMLSDDAGEYDILHGTHVVLVDGKGRIRGFYRNDTHGFRDLETALRLLVAVQ